MVEAEDAGPRETTKVTEASSSQFHRHNDHVNDDHVIFAALPIK